MVPSSLLLSLVECVSSLCKFLFVGGVVVVFQLSEETPLLPGSCSALLVEPWFISWLFGDSFAGYELFHGSLDDLCDLDTYVLRIFLRKNLPPVSA